VRVKLNQGFDRDLAEMIRCRSETNYRSAADYFRAQLPHQGDCLIDCVAAADDVIDDEQGFMSPWFTYCQEHTFSRFSARPSKICSALSASRTPKANGNAARAGADDRNFRQMTRDITIQAELATQRYCQNCARCRNSETRSGI